VGTERTQLTSTLSTFAVLGFIVGPAFGAIFSQVNWVIWEGVEVEDDEGGESMEGGIKITPYTGPGVLILLLCCTMFVLTAIFLELPKREEDEDDKFDVVVVDQRKKKKKKDYLSIPENEEGDSEEDDQEESRDEEDIIQVSHSPSPQWDLGKRSQNGGGEEELLEKSSFYPPPSPVGLSLSLFLFFVQYMSFALQETITTPLVLSMYNWTQLNVNLLFAFVGLLSFLTSYALRFLSMVGCPDLPLLLSSLLFGLVGCVFLVDDFNPFSRHDMTSSDGSSDSAPSLPLYRFFIGFTLITMGVPVGRIVGLSVYSQLIGDFHPQGVYMGWMLAIGTIPRIIGESFIFLSCLFIFSVS